MSQYIAIALTVYEIKYGAINCPRLLSIIYIGYLKSRKTGSLWLLGHVIIMTNLLVVVQASCTS